MSAKTKEALLDVPVEFGGVSIGEATARLGLKIDRTVLELDQADECFCGHRLDCRLMLGAADDAPGQKHLIEDARLQVAGQADCKQLSVRPEKISTGLTFSLADIDVAELARFSKGQGRLIVNGVFEIPEDDEFKEPSHRSADAVPKADGPWREVPLVDLFSGAILKSLHQAGLKTVGQLADYTAADKRLTDIQGIGPGKAQQIEDRLTQFWESNQDAPAEE